jgi:hypothetical protein
MRSVASREVEAVKTLRERLRAIYKDVDSLLSLGLPNSMKTEIGKLKAEVLRVGYQAADAVALAEGTSPKDIDK